MNFRLFVFSLLLLLPSLALPQSVGTAYLSSQINWSQTSDLYFTVVGGPPNTCGDFLSTRNGFSGYNSGSVCTDGSGNVTRGPWSWANTAADQTDTNIRIEWPNGRGVTYFTTDHVWDKTCPTVSISTASPIYGFNGSASDNQWGAGFDGSWTRVTASFYDQTAGRYYEPVNVYYDSPSEVTFPGEITGMPGKIIGWSFDPSRYETPGQGIHISGHTYVWKAYLTDGDNRCSPITQSMTFTY
jgi:hypothetical protein